MSNIATMWPAVRRDAVARPIPDLGRALAWHRHIHAGVSVPHPDYIGNVRDTDPRWPCLIDHEVAIGMAHAVPARLVPAALDAFIHSVGTATGTLDHAIPVGDPPPDLSAIRAVVRLCSYAHGEWIRIHPFANGNGRTARVWANWLAVRYGLPPFVRLKPRPADLRYAGAASRSMQGDHGPTERLFTALLTEALRGMS